MIVPAMCMNFFRRQYNVVMQLVQRSPEQLFCCKDVSFGHFLPSHCENLICLSNEVV